MQFATTRILIFIAAVLVSLLGGATQAAVATAVTSRAADLKIISPRENAAVFRSQSLTVKWAGPVTSKNTVMSISLAGPGFGGSLKSGIPISKGKANVKIPSNIPTGLYTLALHVASPQEAFGVNVMVK